MERNPNRKRRFIKSTVVLALIACLVVNTKNSIGNESIHQWQESGTIHSVDTYQQTSRQLSDQSDESSSSIEPNSPPKNFLVCGRVAGSDLESWPLQRKYATCSKFNPQTQTLVLEGYETFGRTGNQLQSLMNAFQLVRDRDFQLAIMYNSWAMAVILEFFMANSYDKTDYGLNAYIEKTLCIKIIHHPNELIGWNINIIMSNPKNLFRYRTPSSKEAFRASSFYTLRTLFEHYNTGEGYDLYGNTVRDMCSGIDSLFSEDGENMRSSAVYSVIHLRYLEGLPGKRLLDGVAWNTGCDPAAALQMEPDYVKSILAPLGMLEHPIVVITDGQNRVILEKLWADPEIGKRIQIVPSAASWFGGDATLAIMANVFIGNPASTMSLFIAKSRAALGFGNHYMYRVKDQDGNWIDAYENHCHVMCPPVHTHGRLSEKLRSHEWTLSPEKIRVLPDIKSSKLALSQYAPPRLSLDQWQKHRIAVVNRQKAPQVTKALRELARQRAAEKATETTNALRSLQKRGDNYTDYRWQMMH